MKRKDTVEPDAMASPMLRLELGHLPERAAFKAWIRSHGGSTDWTGAGEYRSAPTECAWTAWQAAVAAERKASQDAGHDCALKRGGVMCRVCDLDMLEASNKAQGE